MQIENGDVVRLKDVWPEFERAVPTDAAAADVIFQTLEREGKIVCRCLNTRVERSPGARTFKCPQCKYETWFTAKTVLKRTTNLRAWLAAIYLKQNRVVVTPAQLARLTEISQTGAYEIHTKLNLVLSNQISDQALRMSSESFAGAICKRSRETQARLHPVTEEFTAALNHPPYVDNAGVESDFAPEESEGLIAADSALDLPDDLPVSSYTRLLPVRFIIAAIAFIKRYCHGISRKYLQLYLAGFCFQFAGAGHGPDSLLSACLGHPPISYNDILAYVTASLVQFPVA